MHGQMWKILAVIPKEDWSFHGPAILFYFMCTDVLPACMPVKLPDHLELELQTVVSCNVGAGN